MNPEARICLRCIGDEALRQLVRESATRMKCSFCKSRRLGVPLKTLAKEIDEVYRENYEPGGWYSVPGPGDDDRTYHHQWGEFPENIIQGMAEIEPEVANAIIKILAGEEAYAVARDGADAYYEIAERYVKKDVFPGEQFLSWQEFYQRIKHHRRYFDETARSALHGLLGNLEELEPSPVLTLQPGDPCSVIFRARRAATPQEAEKLQENARCAIGPPPPEKATAGRMNAHGIPVFYGAFSEEVAVAEIRPYVGGLIVVGKFEIIRPLKLLDLSQYLRHAYPGSMFAPSYHYRVTQWKFLRQFLSIICRPIQPSDEALEYVATQAIAEYLASELKFDGIVYPSAQVGGIESDDNHLNSENDEALLSSSNIALFEAIGIVESENPDSNAPSSSERINSTSCGMLDFEELWKSSIQESKNKPYSLEPIEKKQALRYIEHSASTIRVTAIKVSYESFREQEGDGWY